MPARFRIAPVERDDQLALVERTYSLKGRVETCVRSTVQQLSAEEPKRIENCVDHRAAPILNIMNRLLTRTEELR